MSRPSPPAADDKAHTVARLIPGGGGRQGGVPGGGGRQGGAEKASNNLLEFFGQMFSDIGNLDTALRFLSGASELKVSLLANSVSAAHIYVRMGTVEEKLGGYEKALELYDEDLGINLKCLAPLPGPDFALDNLYSSPNSGMVFSLSNYSPS